MPVEAAHKLHAAIAGSTLVIYDKLGHAPEEEDPGRNRCRGAEVFGGMSLNLASSRIAAAPPLERDDGDFESAASYETSRAFQKPKRPPTFANTGCGDS